MDIKHIIRTSFISLLALGMIGGTLNGNIANAKHRRYHYRSHRIIRHRARRRHARKHRRVRRRTHYVRASHVHGHGLHVGSYGYTLNDMGTDFLVHYNGGKISNTPLTSQNYATKAIPGYRVKIIGAKRAHGHLFYKIISDPTEGNNEDDGWIYSGVLGTRSNQQAHDINLSKYQPNDNESNNTNNSNDNTSSNAVYVPHQNHQEKSTERWTLRDINNAREQQGLSPLSETSELQQIAAMRAKQLDGTMLDHRDPNTGENYYREDADQLGYGLSDYTGENLDSENYYSTSGKTIAKNSTNGMLNDDADSDWVHRENILNPNYNYIGIGAHRANGDMGIEELFTR